MDPRSLFGGHVSLALVLRFVLSDGSICLSDLDLDLDLGLDSNSSRFSSHYQYHSVNSIGILLK